MDHIDNKSEYNKRSLYSTTTEISRETFVEEITVKQRACLEIIGFGEENKVIELGEEEVIIGRTPECGICLSIENVSRRHARVIFRNEEYFVEDLGSTNGTYVNGIKTVKCVLRNSDQINIGGVKILFTEDKTPQKI
ncbi:MAG: FHA domain-containing protein [Deltaproteobacteria bacterium]|nr:FHA domain-containing protein [Deltaproteobacteria bacterium]